MPSVSTSPQTLNILSTLIEEKTGIYYGQADLDLMRDKILPRVEDLGYESLLDYYYLLRYDDEGGKELDTLVDLLVVPETYFFREFEAVKLIVTSFIEPLVLAGKTPRIWCAASATGEEPLTLAMLLEQAGIRASVKVVASDLSHRNLARARAGVYGPRSLRHVPEPSLVERFLERTERGVRLKQDLGAAIDWRRVNLVDAGAVEALGTFDVVLCRNVLIYFKDQTAARVLTSIRNVLLPEGALFVGASESLLRLGTSFVCEERGGVFFYKVKR